MIACLRPEPRAMRALLKAEKNFMITRTLALIVLLSLTLSAGHHTLAQLQESPDVELKDVVIKMKQENHCGCFDCCAEYSVSIAGDGTVIYDGIAAVSVTGKQIYSISVADVEELVREFDRADFFSLKDKYTSKDNGDGTISTIDHTTPVTTSITIKGRAKSVYNFYGAPEKLKELEKKIYEVSQVGIFVKRT